MKIVGIIPSRMESKRLPGKPLLKIGEKSMIQRVYESAIKCKTLNDVYVASDNDDIINHVKLFGNVIRTSSNPINGTERVYEAYLKLQKKYDFIINIQGDEPFIKSNQINDLIQICNKKNDICTLIKEHKYSDKLNKNSIIKVVINKDDEAMYFSRSLIPNENKDMLYHRHIGIYGYKPSVLSKLVELNPSSLEIAESLEQLRWLENNFKIKVAKTNHDSFGIDTKNDWKVANEIVKT